MRRAIALAVGLFFAVLALLAASPAKVEVSQAHNQVEAPLSQVAALRIEDAPTPVAAQAEPLTGQLLFSTADAGGWGDLFVINADGTMLRQVSRSRVPQKYAGLALSPDGAYLAYSVSNDLSPDIVGWVTNTDVPYVHYTGAPEFQIKPSTFYVLRAEESAREFNYHFTWSADGKRLLYTLANLTDTTNLTPFFVSAADGKFESNGQISRAQRQPILTGYANVQLPRFSPDGALIAFSSNVRNKQYDIALSNAEGAAVRWLTETPYDELAVSWSPDGTELLLSANPNGQWDLYKLNIANGALTQLTDSPEDEDTGDFSPDGRHIAFTARHGERMKIYLMRADGSASRRLTALPDSLSETRLMWVPSAAVGRLFPPEQPKVITVPFPSDLVRYTSKDGKTSFNVPRGWQVREETLPLLMPLQGFIITPHAASNITYTLTHSSALEFAGPNPVQLRVNGVFVEFALYPSTPQLGYRASYPYGSGTLIVYSSPGTYGTRPPDELVAFAAALGYERQITALPQDDLAEQATLISNYTLAYPSAWRFQRDVYADGAPANRAEGDANGFSIAEARLEFDLPSGSGQLLVHYGGGQSGLGINMLAFSVVRRVLTGGSTPQMYRVGDVVVEVLDSPSAPHTMVLLRVLPDGTRLIGLASARLENELTALKEDIIRTLASIRAPAQVALVPTAEPSAMRTDLPPATRAEFEAATPTPLTQLAQPTAVPPSATAMPQATAVPAPTKPQTCPGALPSRLVVGKRGRVTPGDPNNVRTGAGRGFDRIGRIPAGGIFEVLGGPTCADGFAWWRVDYRGLIGWTAESDSTRYWLEPLD
jgi:Tol biopolymer transport system component